MDRIVNEISNGTLISAVISSPHERKGALKIAIRLVIVKGILKYQMTEQYRQTAVHRNLLPQECSSIVSSLFPGKFRQAIFKTETNSFHLLVSKRNALKIIEKAISKNIPCLEHNRKKQYSLQEGLAISFLVELGIMTKAGKIIAKKYDKFRQINRFIEIVDDIIERISHNPSLNIIDFGCGKAYLTFALYHYLHEVKKFQVKMVGIDRKSEVIELCSGLAKKLCYENLNFFVGEIEEFEFNKNVDVMVSLHACDTATDAALKKAIQWNANAILCVPCCQHELLSQIQNSSLASLMRHGILKERFASLATDAARAELLTMHGYDTQIMEFIDFEHTSKNLLIRAVKSPHSKKSEMAVERYRNFKEALQIHPSLERTLLHNLPL